MYMSANEKIRLILGRKGMTITELATAMGEGRQNLYNKMRRDNFTESELRRAAEALGCQVEVVFTFPDGTQI